jgi:ABC-2 type transport system ATP-binding protein
MRVMVGLTPQNAGTALIGGHRFADIPNPSRHVGVLLDASAQHAGRTGREVLRLSAETMGIGRERVESMLELVGLSGSEAKRRVRNYSLGMRQRLALAATLVRPCRLLILDEPTNGLDPQGTREVRHLIRKLASEGITVFLSSHLLAEIEQVCSHAAVLFAGRMVAQGSLDDLRAAQKRILRVDTPDIYEAAQVLARLDGIGVVTADGDGAETVHAELLDAASEDVTAALVHAGVRVRALVPEQPTLEDTFVALTGEGFDVAE